MKLGVIGAAALTLVLATAASGCAKSAATGGGHDTAKTAGTVKTGTVCTAGQAANGYTLTVPEEPDAGVNQLTASCWASIAPTKEAQVDTGTVPAGASAVFKVAWSQKALYVWAYAAKWPLYDAGRDAFEHDGTEFDISGTHSHAGPFGSHTFYANVIEGTNKVAAIQGNVATPLNAMTKVIQGKRYNAELIVPWSAVKVAAPAKGQTFQFDPGQDFGNGSGARVAQIFWAGVPASNPDWAHKTTQWGEITLG